MGILGNAVEDVIKEIADRGGKHLRNYIADLIQQSRDKKAFDYLLNGTPQDGSSQDGATQDIPGQGILAGLAPGIQRTPSSIMAPGMTNTAQDSSTISQLGPMMSSAWPQPNTGGIGGIGPWANTMQNAGAGAYFDQIHPAIGQLYRMVQAQALRQRGILGGIVPYMYGSTGEPSNQAMPTNMTVMRNPNGGF